MAEHEEFPDRGKQGWWTMSDHALLDLLRRANAGENPELLMLEMYVNSDVEQVGGEDGSG